MDEEKIETIDVGTPDTSGPFTLELALGAGTLELNPGAGSKIVQGTVTYNVDELKPTVTVNGNNVRIEQRRPDFSSYPRNMRNDWDLRLGDAMMTLKLSVGAAKGSLELGGLALTGLNIAQGASDFTVAFSRPNTIPLEKLQLSAGAAQSRITGLANANAAEMELKGGAGKLSLAFDGELQRDLRVSITAAAGQVLIDVPAGTPASVSLKGVLAKVVTSGGWDGSGNFYRLRGTGPEITIDLNVSVGHVDLRSS